MSYITSGSIATDLLVVFVLYFVIRLAVKLTGLSRTSQKEGLKIGKFVRGRGGIGLGIGLAGVAIGAAGLIEPWYVASETYAGSSTRLMYIDPLKGFNLSLPAGGSNPLALTNIVAVPVLLALIFAVGIPLLLIDVVAVKRGGSLGRKFIDGGIALLFALVFIFAFVSFISVIVPILSALLGGGTLSSQQSSLLSTISSGATGGSSTAYGPATITWGFGVGAYLFVAAALLRIVGGIIMTTVPSLQPTPTQQGAPTTEPTRRLAAIMFTDIVGYTALTQTSESKAMKLLERHRRVIRPIFPKHSGHEVKTIGDAFLVEFASALEATECAVEMQQTLHDLNEPPSERVRLKIGIHVGDVIHKDNDVYGDAVNIASRIEPLATGGGICISEQVYDQIHNKVPYKLVKLEPKELKNVSFQIDTYRIVLPWEDTGEQPAPPSPPPAT